MLENKNLNSIKIIDEGWGKLGDKKWREGAGRQLFCFKNKIYYHIFLFIFMIITVYYHGVLKFIGRFRNITRTVQIFYNECAICLQEVGTFAPKKCTPVEQN